MTAPRTVKIIAFSLILNKLVLHIFLFDMLLILKYNSQVCFYSFTQETQQSELRVPIGPLLKKGHDSCSNFEFGAVELEFNCLTVSKIYS